MDSIRQLLQDCGTTGGILIVMLLVSLVIFLERFFYYHSCQVNVEGFLHGLFNIIRHNKMIEAVAICDSKPTPVSMVVRAVITHFDKGDIALREATDEAAHTEIPRLERNLKLLGCLGNIAPILGLVGTLLGLMQIFESVEQTGNFTPMMTLIGPVKHALLTTVLGLIVSFAVNCFTFILSERLKTLIADMDKAAVEMTQFMLTKDLPEDPQVSEEKDESVPNADSAAEKSNESLEN